MKNKDFMMSNYWYDDFDLNMICFSVISSSFALGSFFIDSTSGGQNWFVYFLWTLGVTVFLYKTSIAIISSYLEKKSLIILKMEELEKSVLNNYWSRATMFLLGLTGFLWSSSWLYAFGNLSWLMSLQTVIIGFICFFSALFIVISFKKFE